jgi:site-specific DNA recombinase
LPNMAGIKAAFGEAFRGLPHGSEEFSRLMHRIVRRLEVKPFRLIDAGPLELRAFVTIDLAALLPESRGLLERGGIWPRTLVVDLFDPPQRVAFLARVFELTQQGMTERQIATELGLTMTAVQAIAVFRRTMLARDLTDPYEAVDAPPDDLKRCRRHLHPRYRFEPFDPAL